MIIKHGRHFLKDSQGVQRFVGFFLFFLFFFFFFSFFLFFLFIVLFRCWLAGQANSNHSEISDLNFF